MIKIKVAFCESWFKDKKGVQWYKLHFNISESVTAWVPAPKNFPVGTEVVIGLSKDFESGRAKVTLITR